MIRKIIPILGFVIITFVFFWQFFLKGLMPISSDTIVGLYYPYRDLFAENYPNGIPFKNFLITDPVRQQYPWRNLTVNSIKMGSVPSWNPYSMSGAPNIANFQSGVFYPFNILFFLFSFEYSWSLIIMFEPILAGIFLYLYLRNLKIDEYSSFTGGLIFAFSGFFVTWLEWGTVLHSALWLPLILLSIDEISFCLPRNEKFSILNFKFSKYFIWCIILIFSIASSFFAGHLQTFFYIFLLSLIYLLVRVYENKRRFKLLFVFFLTSIPVIIITLIQSVPTLKFILLSGRSLDQSVWQKEGWFVPYQHLIQFFAPDFFGNPTTLNYWGIWNYGELTGYAGITALILSLFALIYRRDKKVLFYGLVLLTSLVFTTSNFISKLPYVLNIPFISTAQPTRLLFIAGFSISVLAALGLNFLIEKGRFRQIIIPVVVVGSFFALLFISTFVGKIFHANLENLVIAKRNILFPGLIFVLSAVVLFCIPIVGKKIKPFFLIFLILIIVMDLFRFSWKFNTFSKPEYLYPETRSLNYIQKNIGEMRIATSDPRIMPPNFSIMHEIQSAEGYDPLYLERYAEFISAINRDKPDINPPFGFNRIIRIENYSSSLIDLLGIKYVLSMSDLNVKGFSLVMEDGQIKVYENKEVLPKAFFVDNLIFASSKQEAIDLMFKKDFNPSKTAITEERIAGSISKGNARIIKYSPEEVHIETENANRGFLVLTDSFYPTWHAMINDQDVKIYRTDFNFRGIFVPKGKQIVVFKNKLL